MIIPTAGTKYLQVQVQHKDGSFTSEPIDCVDEIENGGFVRIGSFSFSGDGSEYVRLQLASGHDAQFLRSSAMLLSLPAVDGKDEFYADDPVQVGTSTISGQTVTVPLTCRNSSGIRDCIAICASYDENGRLVEMVSLSLELLSPDTTQNISFSFSTPQDALAHKVFVWNSFLSAAPRMRAEGKQQ